MQRKILDRIKEIATNHGLETVQTGSVACNVGSMSIQPENDFAAVLNFSYDFQSGYCSLAFFDGKTKAFGGNTMVEGERGCVWAAHHLLYNEVERVYELCSWLTEYLEEACRNETSGSQRS